MTDRASGILLHVTSLPTPYGIGDLGPSAYQFVEFLAAARQSYWQILPLNPTSVAYDNSPYSCLSAFAGNPILISLELLEQEGLLTRPEIKNVPRFKKTKVDYLAAAEHKKKVLGIAFERWRETGAQDPKFHKFREEHSPWLEDHALFIALREYFDGALWCDWPGELRQRQEGALQEWREKLKDRIYQEEFLQFIFFKQWCALKAYCNDRGIKIIGDIPIYVNYDSAEVWSNPGLFKLDEVGRRTAVAGVPPDYFSATGQIWDNPVYRWDVLRQTKYAWWIQRMEHNFKLFDLVRLDHFRGFVAFWEIPAGEETAVNGKWQSAPASDFFNSLISHFVHLPIIAEDLGIITPDVKAVIDDFGFPGMKLLLFAFGEDLPSSPYAPHNHTENSVVYTGTHDNNTIVGWFKEEAHAEDRKRLWAYLGEAIGESKIHWALIRLAMMSVARLVIIPMQDVLGLGNGARMNQPATKTGNWGWRLQTGQLTESLRDKLASMTRIYGRAPAGGANPYC